MEADYSVMTPEGVTSIPVVIDLMSLGLMKGESQQRSVGSGLTEKGPHYITPRNWSGLLSEYKITHKPKTEVHVDVESAGRQSRPSWSLLQVVMNAWIHAHVIKCSSQSCKISSKPRHLPTSCVLLLLILRLWILHTHSNSSSHCRFFILFVVLILILTHDDIIIWIFTSA